MTNDRQRLADRARHAELLGRAEGAFNAATLALPEALRRLGDAPDLQDLHSITERERDHLEAPFLRLERAGQGLDRITREGIATRDPLDTDDKAIADAYLELAAWAQTTAAHFLRALAWQELPSTREDVAEDALWSATVDPTVEPWSPLFDLAERARQAGEHMAAETRRDCRGWLRGHDLFLSDLREAGQARLAGMIEHETRRPVAEMWRIGGCIRPESSAASREK
ncbi:MAG: hypothetical protein ACREPV_13810 [Lysobacter sp.]